MPEPPVAGRCDRCGDLPGPGGPPGACPRCGAAPGTGPVNPSEAGLAAGLAAPFRGAAFLLPRPGLLLLAAAPFFAALLLAVLLAAAGFALAGGLAPGFAAP